MTNFKEDERVKTPFNEEGIVIKFIEGSQNKDYLVKTKYGEFIYKESELKESQEYLVEG